MPVNYPESFNERVEDLHNEGRYSYVECVNEARKEYFTDRLTDYLYEVTHPNHDKDVIAMTKESMLVSILKDLVEELL